MVVSRVTDMERQKLSGALLCVAMRIVSDILPFGYNFAQCKNGEVAHCTAMERPCFCPRTGSSLHYELFICSTPTLI